MFDQLEEQLAVEGGPLEDLAAHEQLDRPPVRVPVTVARSHVIAVPGVGDLVGRHQGEQAIEIIGID